MVPVIDHNGKCLFPCKERRAKALMKREEAVAYWQKGIFCIRLVRKETEKREEYPAIALGIDPGSKREGYTVATAKGVILNITTNTPDWVKGHMEVRQNLRRARRYRKTPYRACRQNRATLRKKGRIPPSTKARWNAKLRVMKRLLKIIPITIVNVEDIQAVTKTGKPAWNKSFSPLEHGKNWFYTEIKKLDVTPVLTQGTTTKQHRDARGLTKSQAKLDYTWEAHNVDAHSLAEIALGLNIEPYLGLWKVEFIRHHRRQLHVQKPAKGGKRKQYGSTVSMGMSRGSVLRYIGKKARLKSKLCYLGGSMNEKVSIHSMITDERKDRRVNVKDIKVLYANRWRAQFLPRTGSWVILRAFA